MKNVVTSLFTAMSRSRADKARAGDRIGAQAQGMPMTELAAAQLRHVAGGDDGLPKGSWGLPVVNQ
jgi:hypothetical protein